MLGNNQRLDSTGVPSSQRVSFNPPQLNEEDQRLWTAIDSFVTGLDECRSNVNAWTGGAISFDALNGCADRLSKHKNVLEKTDTQDTRNHVDILKTVFEASSGLARMAIEIEKKRDQFAPNWAVKALAYCADVLGVALCAAAFCCVGVIAPVAIPTALGYVGGLSLLAAGGVIKRWAAGYMQHASKQSAALTRLLDNTRKMALRAESLATITALKATLSDAAKEHFKALLDPAVVGTASDAEAAETLLVQTSRGSTAQMFLAGILAGYFELKGDNPEEAIGKLGEVLNAEAELARGQQSDDAYKAFQSGPHRATLAKVGLALVPRQGFRSLVIVNVDCHGAFSTNKAEHSRWQAELNKQGVVQFLGPRSLTANPPPSEESVQRGAHAFDNQGRRWAMHTESDIFEPARVLPNDCVALRFGARFGPGGCIQTVNGFYALTDDHEQPRDAAALVQAITTQTRLQWPATDQPFQTVDKLRVLAAMEAGKRKAVFGLEHTDLPTYTANVDLSEHPGKKKPMADWLSEVETAGLKCANQTQTTGAFDWHALAKEVDERWASGVDEATFTCTVDDCDRVGQHLGVTIIASTPPDATSHSTSADVRSHAATLFGASLQNHVGPGATLVYTPDTTHRPPLHAAMPPPLGCVYA